MCNRINTYCSCIEILIVIASSWFVLVFVYVVAQRLFYPFELEWIEGVTVNSIIRISRGQPLFLPPNAEFIPLIYTPLYFFLSGILAKFFGIGFWLPRLVSVLSALLIGYLIYKIVTKETRNIFAGFVASAAFFASYQITGAWIDTAKPDSLCMVFILLGCYLLQRKEESNKYVIVSAIFLCLAFFTKQSAVFFIITTALYLLKTDRIKGLMFSLAVFLILCSCTLWLNHSTNNWFWTYMFTLPSKQPTFPIRYFIYLTELIGIIPFLLPFICTWLFIKTSRKFISLNLLSLWGFSFLAALAASAAMRQHQGGFSNAFIPIMVFSAIVIGIVIGKIYKAGNGLLRNLLCASLLLQFIFLIYNPLKHIPSPQDYNDGEKFIEELRNIKGDVFVTHHAFYPVMVGKKMYAHLMPIWDIFISDPNFLPDDLLSMVNNRKIPAIILPFEISGNLKLPLFKSIYDNYYPARQIDYKKRGTFLPITGYKIRPKIIYRPKKQ